MGRRVLFWSGNFSIKHSFFSISQQAEVTKHFQFENQPVWNFAQMTLSKYRNIVEKKHTHVYSLSLTHTITRPTLSECSIWKFLGSKFGIHMFEALRSFVEQSIPGQRQYLATAFLISYMHAFQQHVGLCAHGLESNIFWNLKFNHPMTKKKV